MANKTGTNQSLTQQVLVRSAFFAFAIIPTAITIMIAIEVRSMKTLTDIALHGEPQIVCFEQDICAIEVYGKWYRIDGVIKMDETVPEEYLFRDLINESRTESKDTD